jgi:hypothetical protein
MNMVTPPIPMQQQERPAMPLREQSGQVNVGNNAGLGSGSAAGLGIPPIRPQSNEAGRYRALTPATSAINDVDDDSDLFLDEDEEDVTENTQLPVPEPEAKPLQRPVGAQQRHVRRLDRGAAADMARNNRNAPPGDAIDIPAFLRKR